jgi:hypothetical protein
MDGEERETTGETSIDKRYFVPPTKEFIDMMDNRKSRQAIEPVKPVEKIEKLSDLAVTFGVDVDRGQPLHEKITEFIPPSQDSVVVLTEGGMMIESLNGGSPPVPRRVSKSIHQKTRLDSDETEQFLNRKLVRFKGGPLDGMFDSEIVYSDENGLLYFFREVRGEIEQCVYRIVLKEREKPLLAAEASDEEKAAHRALPREWDWVGDYVGKRKCPVPMVNGIRKGRVDVA